MVQILAYILMVLGLWVSPSPPVAVAPVPVTTTTSTTIAPPPVDLLVDLRDCIAYYESTNGAGSSNLYQFIPSTWKSYGGVGAPEDASVAEQDRIFDLAWADAGPHHWEAQSGRCF